MRIKYLSLAPVPGCMKVCITFDGQPATEEDQTGAQQHRIVKSAFACPDCPNECRGLGESSLDFPMDYLR